MIKLYFIICLCLGFYIFVHTRFFKEMFKGVRKGPKILSRKPTMFDVRTLIVQGEKELAVRVYREIFKTGLDEAKKQVDELERSIQEKNESE